ncbi:DUF4249 family protein [uncultured Croceitalea sp.]|uniref:DUF4249 family protein n=1 Tax=uncultured Croceitalea sp. TaxID=1798908 RepID=UPI00374EFD05
MKKVFIILVIISVFSSCEDVIEVEVPTIEPRLNVDALIRVEDESTSTQVEVKITLTSSFFEESIIPQIDLVTITNLDAMNTMDDNVIVLEEDVMEPGVYTNIIENNFLEQGRLLLTINYQGIIYTATTQFVPTVPINSLRQGTETLFGGDETEVIVSFIDNGTRDDFYLFDFDFNEFLVTEDLFYQGQEFEFSYFYDDEINPGQEIEISILGVDQEFYNYMNQLIVQAGGDQGPFQTPASTIRGNIINLSITDNTSQSQNFPLGYFAVVQEFKQSLIIEDL